MNIRALQQASTGLHQPARTAASFGHYVLSRRTYRAACQHSGIHRKLAGGEFFHFRNAKDLKANLIVLSNDLPNYYVLSFRPTEPTPGLHALHVEAQSQQPLVVNFQSEYWIEDDTPR